MANASRRVKVIGSRGIGNHLSLAARARMAQEGVPYPPDTWAGTGDGTPGACASASGGSDGPRG